jgi:hypothetical protein
MFALLLAAGPVAAQLPTATGRQFTLSNAAWKLFIPSTYQYRSGNVADVLVHFHGDPQTYWNNTQYAKLNAMIVTVNYSGLSSAYSTPFSNASLFQTVVNEALIKARAEADIPDSLQWDKLGVSSFSAGYGAVREILKSSTYRNDIDALRAADSLYASTAGDGTPLDSQMVDYKTFAAAAKAGTKTFLFSHSQVPTYTYETTGECGDELMQSLGISASAYNVNGLGTLNFYRHAKSDNFELWGALGTNGDSHLEHLRYIGEFLKGLPLAKVAPVGDYNRDGKVDTADYIVWRDSMGSTSNLLANGDNTGTSFGKIDAADYTAWRKNFGSTSAGSGAALSETAVPEPAAWVILLGLAMQVASVRGYRSVR